MKKKDKEKEKDDKKKKKVFYKNHQKQIVKSCAYCVPRDKS